MEKQTGSLKQKSGNSNVTVGKRKHEPVVKQEEIKKIRTTESILENIKIPNSDIRLLTDIQIFNLCSLCLNYEHEKAFLSINEPDAIYDLMGYLIANQTEIDSITHELKIILEQNKDSTIKPIDVLFKTRFFKEAEINYFKEF